MSTIRIDKKHQKLLDKLIATLTLRGIKTTKKHLIGELIENALNQEGVPITDDELPPLKKDPAWTHLEDVYTTGLDDLSENIDQYLYKEKE